MRDLPNILTFSRIALIPILLFTLYLENVVGYWITGVLFAIASLTDYFDGMIARKMNAYSTLGKILDPIADKLLVSSLLMMLVYYDRAPIIPAILILCREVLVSGLREHLAEFKASIPVSNLAKIKTALQFISILILILGTESTGIKYTTLVGEIMIWVTAVLTVFTGFEYCREGFSKIDLS